MISIDVSIRPSPDNLSTIGADAKISDVPVGTEKVIIRRFIASNIRAETTYDAFMSLDAYKHYKQVDLELSKTLARLLQSE